MPSDDEIDRMEEIQKELGDYETERQTPAFRQAQSEIMRRRHQEQDGESDQPEREQLDQSSQEGDGQQSGDSQQSSDGQQASDDQQSGDEDDE